MAKRGSAKEGEREQIAIRLDRSTIKQLDTLADKLSRPGLALSRADALRIALATGIESLEREAAKR